MIKMSILTTWNCKFNIIPIKILVFSPRTRYVNFKVNREK